MSPKLPRITAAELVKALKREGWFESRQSGSHLILRHLDRTGHVAVPMHAGKTVAVGLLSSILSDAGLNVNDLRRLL
ncbi:MAG: type II toxin-antitoxin system HicA family toxin [Dehalococcoidia bacterium]|nr:type II toxin-antitoxin system HicA family toxin [Dehalococcoidia bacterium]